MSASAGSLTGASRGDANRSRKRRGDKRAVGDRPPMILDGAGWDSAAAHALERAWRDKPGVLGFLTTNDHKRIGRRFVVTALVFFAAAGMLAAVMRLQLAVPDNHLVGPDLYNQLFTIHGTTMMFIFAVPVMQGLAVYFVPLMAGTRNTAFPRMTACAYWLYL